jgi:hypothetical protein
MENMGGAWGSYSVMGPDGFTQNELPHELNHIWQSRAFGDIFLPNYALQGINAALQDRNIWGFIFNRNFFEGQAEVGW